MGAGFYKALAFSLTLALIASVWVWRYGAARRGRRYAEGRTAVGRTAVGRDDSFKVLGKVIFVAMNAVTFASFWADSRVLLHVLGGDAFRVAGLVVLIAATFLYLRSMDCLGDNYSPCFDPHLPRGIVTRGPYRYVRHPVYLANILQGVGYTLASGSLWVLLLSGYGVFGILSALWKEESYLSETFPGYESYRAKTSRLIPFIY
jgi:protein-S-isoprenylcysteine O-methyltransferase Ste14